MLKFKYFMAVNKGKNGWVLTFSDGKTIRISRRIGKERAIAEARKYLEGLKNPHTCPKCGRKVSELVERGVCRPCLLSMLELEGRRNKSEGVGIDNLFFTTGL